MPTEPDAQPTPHYKSPDGFTKRVLNPSVAFLTRLGVSLHGSRVLEVPGRKTGNIQRTPVNLLVLDGNEYLVSPRGEGDWVRNVRANDGDLDVVVGRRRSHRKAEEITDEAKLPILREYLRKWGFEVGMFFEGVKADSPAGDLAAIVPKHPVFVLRDPASQS